MSVGRPITPAGKPNRVYSYIILMEECYEEINIAAAAPVAFGMLAAVESKPSNIVGYVKYPAQLASIPPLLCPWNRHIHWHPKLEMSI